MHRFWKLALEPLITAVGPERVLEIGAESGALTLPLLQWAEAHDAVVHSIDPGPKFNVDEWRKQFRQHFVFHRALSLDALPKIDQVDLALIDGDHNWYTVINELRLLDRHAQAPVIALHDVDWPYGRRDLYYAPENIPAEYRHEYAREAMRPGSKRLESPGLNGHLFNAVHEGGARNGVRTAIEDFFEESPREWIFASLAGLHGLAILAPGGRVRGNPELKSLLSELGRAAALRRVAREIEAHRLWTEIRRVEARQNLVDRSEALESLQQEVIELRDELGAARERLPRPDVTLPAATAEPTPRSDAEHERLQAELDGLRGINDRLQADVDTLKTINERLQEDLRERDHALELELDRARVRAEGAEAAKLQATSRIASLEQRLNDLELESTEAATGRDVLLQSIRVLTDERDRARQAIADLDRALNVAEERQRALEARVSPLEQSVAAAQQARRAAELTMSQLQMSLDDSNDENLRLRRHLRRAELRLEEARRARDRFRELEQEMPAMQPASAPPAPEPVPTPGAPAAPPPVRPITEPVGEQLSRVADPPAPTAAPEPPPASAPAAPPRAARASMLTEPSPEAIERRHFVERVVALLPEGERFHGTLDPLAKPEISNRRGFLVASHQEDAGGPTVDVAVCVHNAPDDVRSCLWSLTAYATYPFHLIVVDDGSDIETARLVDRAAAAIPELELIRNAEPPHGYTIAANLALRRSTADYVILLNSDTIVSSGWLERLIECGESDPKIGVLGPLSNAATHQSVPELRAHGAWATNELPGWLTTEGMATLIELASTRARPRLPFINGFCYVIKRAALDAVGLFDEQNFASGYCEENDFSYRAQSAGFELAVADNAYVYHAKSKSYTVEGRNERAKRNYQIFLDKHDRAHIDQLVGGMEENRSLQPLRDEIAHRLSSPLAAADLITSRSSPLTIVFILPGLGKGGSGGSHSIYQEVSGLRDLGIPATIALSAHAWDRAQVAYDNAEEIFRPFADVDELAAVASEAHVISATHFKSVALLAHLRSLRDDFLPAYYVQDYEPFFMLPDHPDHAEARASYTAISDALLFAKTHWLCNAIGHAHGLHVAKVEPSIDSMVYRPGPKAAEGPVRVVAMVRLRTPRRQPHGTVALLEQLRRDYGDLVETVTFGCELAELKKLTGNPQTLAAHHGLLRRQQVADLMRSADVLLDNSTYQAFGRTALEAMACGCTAVVPRIGGAAEFAVHGENCLIADTCDEASTYEALCALVTDREQLRLLQAGAVATAARYSIVRAALSEYVLFDREYRRRFATSPSEHAPAGQS